MIIKKKEQKLLNEDPRVEKILKRLKLNKDIYSSKPCVEVSFLAIDNNEPSNIIRLETLVILGRTAGEKLYRSLYKILQCLDRNNYTFFG